MRDLQADKEMCGNATPGPWDVMKPIIGRRAWCVVEQEEQDAGYHNLICRRDNTKNRKLDCNNVKFIAASREGWPEAIERAIKAEAEVDRLRLMVKSITGGLDECMETVHFLEAENDKLRNIVDLAKATKLAFDIAANYPDKDSLHHYNLNDSFCRAEILLFEALECLEATDD